VKLRTRTGKAEPGWSEWQVRRLVQEREMLKKAYPDFSFFNQKSTSAYVEGRWTSDLGRSYTIRVQLHAAYPDVVPSVYIMDPYPLVGFGGRAMDTYGSSHLMHTFESDIPSATRVCTVRPETWDARWFISNIIRRTMLWILAYEFQCDDGTPVYAFLID
jgi:hypothetical protein